jgi:hypothetical protein
MGDAYDKKQETINENRQTYTYAQLLQWGKLWHAQE